MAVITLHRTAPAWVEEPHFEPSAIRRAIAEIERAARTV
jgi:hypothetical protein